jgi:hypothetical protein
MTEETQTNNTEKKSVVSRAWGWIKEQKGTIAVFVAGAATGVAATLGIQKYRQGQEEETVVIDDGLEDQYPLQ